MVFCSFYTLHLLLAEKFASNTFRLARKKYFGENFLRKRKSNGAKETLRRKTKGAQCIVCSDEPSGNPKPRYIAVWAQFVHSKHFFLSPKKEL